MPEGIISARTSIVESIRRLAGYKHIKGIIILTSLIILIFVVPIIPVDSYSTIKVIETRTQTIDSSNNFTVNPKHGEMFGADTMLGDKSNVTVEIRSNATVRIYVLNLVEYDSFQKTGKISYYQAKFDVLNDTVEIIGVQRTGYVFFAFSPSLDDDNVKNETIKVYSTRIVAQWNQESIKSISSRRYITIWEHMQQSMQPRPPMLT